MKYIIKFLMPLILSGGLTIIPTCKADAQIEAVLEAIKAAIKAIDLQVQRAQNHIIDLQNIQKKIENTLSQLKLTEIGDWVQKQKDLYTEYYDELWKVKTIIAYFKQITDIVNAQKQLISEYKTAYSLLQRDTHFSPQEVSYSFSVYLGIVDASVKSVDEILNILESFSLQMSDAERLKIIGNATNEIQQQISDLRKFTNQNIQLSMQRAKDQGDLNFVKQLYGIPN